MVRTVTLFHGVLLLGLAGGGLSGCGSPTDKDLPALTEAQKAERAAQAKETEESFKDFAKNKKKEPIEQRPKQKVNGVSTS